jgi:hypothetical protein
MKSEYLYTHAQLRSTIVRGKTTAEIAGLNKTKLENVFDYIMNELVREMAQHGLHPRMIESPIRQRIQELEATSKQGRRLGGGTSTIDGTGNSSARELAFAAAKRRAREQQQQHEQQKTEHDANSSSPSTN